MVDHKAASFAVPCVALSDFAGAWDENRDPCELRKDGECMKFGC